MAAVPDIYSRDPSLYRPGYISGGQSKLNPPISPEECSVQYHIAVIIQNLDGPAHLVLSALHPSFDPAKCMKKIRHEYRDALCKLRKSPLSSLFTKSIIGTARVQLVIAGSPEPTTKYSYPRVFLREFSPSELLCHSWHDPTQLGHHRTLQIISDEDLLNCLSTPEDLHGKRAIVVRQVLSKTKIAVMLLVLLGLGSVMGVVVGMCTGRADIALAVAAGGFACVTVLQSLVAWLVA